MADIITPAKSDGSHDPSVIDIHAATLPEAWEKSILACWNQGLAFRTEYDKDGDPPSRDCVARLVVLSPMEEPRLHKAMPAGLEDLEIYRQEVLYGVHDNWIDPAAGKWEYTYHERLFDYRVHQADGSVRSVDQMEAVIEKLAASPHTRRAQAFTWQCWQDLDCFDPPCLQRLWFRLQEREVAGKREWFLNLNITMRSNDAFKAAFMNMYAFTELQAWVAQRLGKKMGCPVHVGRYIHMADSYHIYGAYFREVERFVSLYENQPLENRVIRSCDVQYFFDSGRITLFNNTQSDIPLPLDHLKRLYAEIPEDRRGELLPLAIKRLG